MPAALLGLGALVLLEAAAELEEDPVELEPVVELDELEPVVLDFELVELALELLEAEEEVLEAVLEAVLLLADVDDEALVVELADVVEEAAVFELAEVEAVVALEAADDTLKGVSEPPERENWPE
jgi:hypothetical protein